jgi:hypothetical protein
VRKKFDFTHVNGDKLPKETYVSLVGTFSHLTLNPVHYNPINAHHCYLWLLEPDSGLSYECAVHTRLSINADTFVCVFKEPCVIDRWPGFGVLTDEDARLSYDDWELESSNFKAIGERAINEEMTTIGTRSARFQVYGVTGIKGNGIHDIHRNCGEPKTVVLRPNRENEDGALCFYMPDTPGVPAHRIWFCFKYEVQFLGKDDNKAEPEDERSGAREKTDAEKNKGNQKK